jgi:VanZ family protein
MGSIESNRRGTRNSVPSLLLTATCAVLLGVILFAGLWPFHAPKNEVSWLSNGNGLLFGDHGSLLSAGAFSTSSSMHGACLEIWLEPTAISGSGTILSFYPPEHRSTLIELWQWLDEVALRQKTLAEKRNSKAARIYAHVFRLGKPVVLTISSGERGTSIYVNGTLANMSRNIRFSIEDLTVQLVIGNSSVATDTWSGQLKGLAIYNRELTASQVMQHYRSWLGSERPGVSALDGAVALYVFNEGRGDVVHNQVGPAADLMIPEHFFVLHQPFLERPWNEYNPGWRYVKDIGINIAGFIPLGFFYAYFSLVRRVEHPAAVTIAFGFAVSLTIEILQAFLPTRNSGTTDLITNTLGTAIGVIAFSHKAVQFVLSKTVSVPSTVESEVDARNQQGADEKAREPDNRR